jgi:hypothetical protein
MKQNGSPEPVFETDEQCTNFITRLPAWINEKSNQAGDQVNRQILNNIQELKTFPACESNQAGDQARNIIKETLSGKIFIMLKEFAGSSLKCDKRLNIKT